MNHVLELLERLPRLGAAFAADEAEFRVIRTPDTVAVAFGGLFA